MAGWRRASATRFSRGWCSTTDGQLLNASLADYLLPSATDVPHIDLAHTVTKSPLNPLGIKGAGEAGAIPVGALFAQAIEDALGLPGSGVEILEIPLSPARLWQLVTKPRSARRGRPPRGGTWVSEHGFDDKANLAIIWLDVLRNRPGP